MMKLIILIVVVFITHAIIALIPELVDKDVRCQSENIDRKIGLQLPVILRSNNGKSSVRGVNSNTRGKKSIGRGGPIRNQKNQNTNKNDRYQPYKKPEPKPKPSVILTMPENLKMPDEDTKRNFLDLGLSRDQYRGVYSNVIDYCATEIIDRYKRFKKDWIYIPQELATEILQYGPGAELSDFMHGKGLKKFNERWFKAKKIAMPYMTRMSYGHAKCLVADMNLKTVEYYDSAIQPPGFGEDYEYYKREAMDIFKKFKRALKRRNSKVREQIDLKGWKLIQPKFTTQRQTGGVDPPDCNLYVLMFIDGRINGSKRIIKTNNVIKVRKALYKAFMKHIVSRKPKKT